MRPKMNRIDLDYHVLYEAFFKYQTKPAMTKMGDMYFEGKENECHLRELRPGHLSIEARQALGMGEDPTTPPPWLSNMQRYGPPPSYPNLRIPGLNAPIPEGASYGTHPGAWGKPPVDEEGRPLYGNPFGKPGSTGRQAVIGPDGKPVDTAAVWGEAVSEPESEGEEEDIEDEAGDKAGLSEEEVAKGIASVSSVDTGVETPASVVNLRKVVGGTETPMSSAPRVPPPDAQPPANGDRPLYTVLEQQAVRVGDDATFGSSHAYTVSQLGAPSARPKPKPGAVEVALDPAELEGLDEAALRSKYEAQTQVCRNSAGDPREEVGVHGRHPHRPLGRQPLGRALGTWSTTTSRRNDAGRCALDTRDGGSPRDGPRVCHVEPARMPPQAK